MERIKILTDIKILQSNLWTQKTDFINDLSSKKTKLPEGLLKKVHNILSPFNNLVQIVKRMKHYDVIVNANVRTAQLFALFRKVIPCKTPKQIILEVMLDEKKKHLIWKIKRLVQRYIFSSVEIVFVSSKGEIETYSKRLKKPLDQIKFLPFHTNIVEPRLMNRSGNYILSAGKTGRDYRILAAAVKNIDIEVIIVSDKYSMQGITFPPHVKVLTEIPYSQYLKLLYNCRFVVIPLKKLIKSSGQVAFLEAMAVGKPVIATKTVGTKDYIQSGVNGILVSSDDPESLENAIYTLIRDPSFANQIAINALESVINYYTFEKYVTTILNTAEELVGADI